MILITGGAGFIGSHLIQRSSYGKISIIDNLSNFNREAFNYVEIAKDTRIKNFVVDDISKNTDRLKELVLEADYVIHLASNINIPKSFEKKQELLCNDVHSTINLLECCKSYGRKIKNIFFASSASVYGDTYNTPVKEEFSLNPISPYGINKLTNEHYFNLYKREGLPIVIGRFFNVFGERQAFENYGAVIPNFINAVQKQKQPTIFGDGSQVRDFIHVGDLSQIIWKLLIEGHQGTYNIGYGQETSINDLWKMICGREYVLQPKYLEKRVGDVMISRADVSKLHSTLDIDKLYLKGLEKALYEYKDSFE